MTINVLNWVWDELAVESPMEKLVLLDLADQSDSIGFAYPSIDYIARRTGMAVRTVYKWLEIATDKGVITPAAGISKNGYEVQGWRFNLPDHSLAKAGATRRERPRKGCAPRAQNSDQPSARGAKSASLSSETVHHVHGHIGKNHQEPSLNPAPSVAPALEPRVERLRERIGDQFFRAWFGDAEFIEGEPVKLVVPKEFQRNRIKERYHGHLTALFGDDLMILLGGPSDA